VADDDDASLGLLAAWLSDLGYEVYIARDGVELLERLEQVATAGALTAPFLVVTDLDMPRQNGLGVLSVIRERFNGACVLMVTAFGDSRLHSQAHSLGAAAILDKPFSMSRFLSTVDEALCGPSSSRPPSSLQGSELPIRDRRAPPA
jgi:CheY-like chemotaxis protein